MPKWTCGSRKNREHYDPNWELEKRFGKDFDTTVEPEPEIESPERQTHIETHLKLRDEHAEALGVAPEEAINAKNMCLVFIEALRVRLPMVLRLNP